MAGDTLIEVLAEWRAAVEGRAFEGVRGPLRVSVRLDAPDGLGLVEVAPDAAVAHWVAFGTWRVETVVATAEAGPASAPWHLAELAALAERLRVALSERAAA